MKITVTIMPRPLDLREREAEQLPLRRTDYYQMIQMIRSQIDGENELGSMRVI